MCKTEIFSRVTGFYAPVLGFNKGKKEEYKDRKKYDYGTYLKGGVDGANAEYDSEGRND